MNDIDNLQSESVESLSLASSLTVRLLEAAEENRWDEFVLKHEHGSPFHLIAWKRTIEESFSYTPYYFLATEEGRIRGLLPAFLVDNPVVGRVLLSSPFAVYGGILGDSDAVRVALHKHAVATGVELKADYVEFRNAFPEQSGGTPNVTRYVSFSQPLAGDEEALLQALPKKTRNMVRKSLRQPFEMRYDVRDPRLFDDLHARNMRRLGTPNFPIKYFDRLLTNFGDKADIREVWLEGKLTAVSLNLYFRESIHTYHAAADSRYNSLGANTFMYFDHLRWGAQNGYRIFDFGRCKRNTGVFEFKKHWNTTMRELPYEIVLLRRKTMPNFSPANPKFDLPIRIWKHLPMPVARILSRILLPLFP